MGKDKAKKGRITGLSTGKDDGTSVAVNAVTGKDLPSTADSTPTSEETTHKGPGRPPGAVNDKSLTIRLPEGQYEALVAHLRQNTGELIAPAIRRIVTEWMRTQRIRF